MKPLSFIIITYNRPSDALELLKNINMLDGAKELLQDVIIVNNNSSDDYSEVENHGLSDLPIIYIKAEENLGVTKGRNFALQFAKGEICIFLDDDAILQNKDALTNTLKAFNDVGLDNRDIAIVSFKVLYYDTLMMQKNALPHKKFKKYKNKASFFTYYFAGGAHAIKREVLTGVGGLPEDFFYGMEEYDLSFRLIQQGYCIKYDASIIMLHKESPLGRKPKNEKLSSMWVNKCTVAWRYLPKHYFYSTSFLWGVEYLVKTKFDLQYFKSSVKKIFAIPSHNKRTPLNKKSLQYLRKTEARLLY